MSAAKCSKCKGLLPAWLTAAGGATSAKCPNCQHVNDLVAMRTPPPQAAGKGTDAYSTLESQGNGKSPSLNKTMFMGSGTAKAPQPDAQKNVALAQTMMMPQASRPAAKPPVTPPVEAQPQKRTPTLPGSSPMAMPQFPPTTPLPVPAPPPAVVETAAAIPSADVTAIDSGETDADIDVEIDTPPPAPPSKTSLPSWVVTEPLGLGETGAVPTQDRLAFLRERKTLIGGAVGLVGVGLMVLMLTRGSKPAGPVSVEVKRPPAQRFAPPPEPAPEPVKAAPQPEVAQKAVPAPRPEVARKAPEPPAPAARKAPEPAHPHPVAAAPTPAPAPAPAPERKVAVASAQHVAAASPERARRSGVPSEDDQRLAREAYTRGNTQFFQGHADDAIKEFKESMRLDPRNPAAMRGLGLAYGQAGNAAQAVQFLKKYLKASPGASDRALVEKRIEQLSAH